jgi:hypothetical protein
MKYKHMFILISFCFAAIFILQSCKDDNVAVSPDPNNAPEMPFITGLSQVNLVSDVATYNPVRIDPLLVNAWGIAVTPTGRLWISATETHVSVIYDTAGNTVLAPVMIPGASGPGSPTGQIFNTTTSFKIAGVPARFLFASEDGTISGWTSGTTAVIVVNHSASNAVYKDWQSLQRMDKIICVQPIFIMQKLMFLILLCTGKYFSNSGNDTTALGTLIL